MLIEQPLDDQDQGGMVLRLSRCGIALLVDRFGQVPDRSVLVVQASAEAAPGFGVMNPHSADRTENPEEGRGEDADQDSYDERPSLPWRLSIYVRAKAVRQGAETLYLVKHRRQAGITVCLHEGLHRRRGRKRHRGTVDDLSGDANRTHAPIDRHPAHSTS